MKTYSTYQEAKIANPECEIVTTAPGWDANAKCIGAFEPLNTECYGPRYALSDNAWVKCNPADCCMTVEQFLKDGNEFVEGDIYFHIKEEELSVVGRDGFEPGHANTPISDDAESYILRAAALEKTKRTKEAYEKVGFSSTSDAYRAMLDGETLYNHDGSSKFLFDGKNFIGIDDDGGVYSMECHSDAEPFYRKVTNPIEWWEDATEFACSCEDVKGTIANGDVLSICGSMTRDQWCDFARILLEQGE